MRRCELFWILASSHVVKTKPQGCIDDTATAHGQARGIHSSPPTTQEQAQMKWVAYP